MRDEYWRIFCDEVVPELLNVSPTKEQVDKLTSAALNHRDMEWEACGYREADISLERMKKNDAQSEVFAFVEILMRGMDSGASEWFPRLSRDQKTALARLMHIRREFAILKTA